MKIEKDTLIVDENDNFIGKLIAGTTGKIILKTPFFKGGKREIKEIKDSKGKVLKARK